ncbi:MAG TPA: agmatine deiminase family protein [Pyrinomonadaceae bacterium]|jgi:agmatine deiminase|nr:agmatine deiminase family protein [Pyrinomonadaceae bacterium]
MPAEWEPHEAVWLGWPHNASDWPGKIAAIHFVYAEIVRRIVPSEDARIIVNNARHEAKARSVLRKTGLSEDAVEFFRLPSNRGWTRDTGPIFVKNEAGTAVAGFKFNAWAKYDDYALDSKIAKTLAKKLKKKYFPIKYNGKSFVLEGGAIDVNGRGSLLTTEECLLDQEVQVRNPGVTRQEYEQVLAESLGATNVLWLNKGIVGDDTHGHIDDLCRFVDPKTVVLCREKNSKDANYQLLEENRERLEGMRLENGSKIQVEFLPMPEPLIYRGRRLPASYANFLITNSSVLVPTFNDPNDRIALDTLAELLPKRTVVGIHAVDLVWGLGTLHCLSQQQPTG